RYQRSVVGVNPASRPHLGWLRGSLEPYVGAPGCLGIRPPTAERHEFFTLRYGKRDGLRLLSLLYRDPIAPRLERKHRIWQSYLERHPQAAVTVQSMSSPT